MSEVEAPQIDQERNRILNYAISKFHAEGFYKTSMDEIARDLQMSKKTIYKYFQSKEILLEAVAGWLMSESKDHIDSILSSKESVVVKFTKIINIYNSKVLKCSDKWFTDLQIHAPRLWQKIDEFRTNRIYQVLSELIDEGKNEGLVDKEIPTCVIVSTYNSSMRSMINYKFLYENDISVNDAVNHGMQLLLNGILTKKGRQQFALNKINLEQTVREYYKFDT
ncbi:MAG: TetR/AcrR family transcriptional regulator [Ignavibacteriae bacterium]|nr:TetR/AcrR family transcriptional regulator [Ignavibacteriota bacterium]MCB9242652.1 TetR/AcrR family transcriptional regulator [Ignavibacteriales bacterium]